MNNAFKNFVTSRLHSIMCKKNKLRAYRELKEDFEFKNNLYGVSDIWVLSFCSDLDIEHIV